MGQAGKADEHEIKSAAHVRRAGQIEEFARFRGDAGAVRKSLAVERFEIRAVQADEGPAELVAFFADGREAFRRHLFADQLADLRAQQRQKAAALRARRQDAAGFAVAPDDAPEQQPVVGRVDLHARLRDVQFLAEKAVEFVPAADLILRRGIRLGEHAGQQLAVSRAGDEERAAPRRRQGAQQPFQIADAPVGVQFKGHGASPFVRRPCGRFRYVRYSRSSASVVSGSSSASSGSSRPPRSSSARTRVALIGAPPASQRGTSVTSTPSGGKNAFMASL